MKSFKQFKSELQESKQRNIKVTKNGKTRMLRKQELSTYLQMGWKKVNEDDDPCWKGYQMVGMKKKNGKEVPNCVPKESVDEQVIEEDNNDYIVAFRNAKGNIEAEVRVNNKQSAEKQVKIRNKKVKSKDGAWEIIKTPKESVEEGYKSPAEAQAIADGKKAARQGKKYSDNPHKKGSKEFTAWSKGHNMARESVEENKKSHPQGSAKFYRGAMDKYKAKTPKKSPWDLYMDKHKAKK